ncbi:STAS domain-containing protein [Actinomadura rupiterrae]|uniref:STAS domain-containing protein n=1 Tax=Actinomadura rupiterrae TaxID=559627 RepID=UPI0020A3440C|nr:STAS domain-containing protein [Actinomadura rupiterrae]MCP2342254.1 anti-sigma B factor antagonist [Actinomadura rupiterrae]
MQHLRLTVTPQPHGSLVAVAGELDLATATILERCLQGILNHPGGQITVDMSAVGFIDCCGLTALLFADEQAHIQNRRLLVAAPAPRVLQLLQLTGTEKLLEVVPAL